MDERAPTPSAIGSGLLVLGDQWNLLLLEHAFLNHTRRFGDWHAALGISESVLSGRVKELVSAGVFTPTPYKSDGRTRTEYLLTDKGRQLWSFLIAIWSWEHQWVESAAAQVQLVHRSCGASTDAVLGCEKCGATPVTARDTAVLSGPDTTFGNVAVARHHRRTVRDRVHSNPDSYLQPTLEILGDRWSTVVLVAAFVRVRRFADFQSTLGIAPGILSNRLRRFVELAIFTKTGPGAEYRLTQKGLDFFPVFAFLVQWAQDWYPHPPTGGLIITHQSCGERFRAFLQCAHCGQRMNRQDVRFVPAGRG
jgi:DNA-binding HxlR family transcriptional regulator